MLKYDFVEQVYQLLNCEIKSNKEKDMEMVQEAANLYFLPYIQYVAESVGEAKAQDLYTDLVMRLYDRNSENRIQDFQKGIWFGVMIIENMGNKEKALDLLKQIKAQNQNDI